MTSGTQFARDQLKSIVERIEKLEEEKKATSDDIRDVYAEAKGNGFDVTALRAIVRLRKLDADARAEQEAVLDTYMAALGMLPGAAIDEERLRPARRPSKAGAAQACRFSPPEDCAARVVGGLAGGARRGPRSDMSAGPGRPSSKSVLPVCGRNRGQVRRVRKQRLRARNPNRTGNARPRVRTRMSLFGGRGAACSFALQETGARWPQAP